MNEESTAVFRFKINIVVVVILKWSIIEVSQLRGIKVVYNRGITVEGY